MTSPSLAEENKEREAVLRNDQKVQQGSTFLDHARSAADDEAGGRFAKVNASMVIGATPVSQYPRASTPFQSDPVPTEPPLGYAIDQMPEHMSPAGVAVSPRAATGPTPGAPASMEGGAPRRTPPVKA
jgi:hypothetical protein